MKKIMYISVSILAILSLATFVVLSQSRFGKLPKGERLERIQKSPNYKDGKFQNQSYTPTVAEGTSMAKVMYDFLFKKKVRVSPEDSIPSVKTDLKHLPPDKDVIVWFGHSSYLMQIDGKKILVDPVFSGHAGPFRWMVKAFKGANQYSAADMPDIDYLVISHDHWDHLDYNTVVELKPRVKKVICGLGVGAHLEHWGFAPSSIIEMDWYDQSAPDSGWMFTATPARHFSGRGLKRDQTLWASFALQTPSLNIFIGGDGGYDKHFEEIGKRFGPFDIAILEQGQYNEQWKYIHMLPSEVFKAASELRAKKVMPVHNSKFALAAHPWDEPLVKLIENSINYQIPVVTGRIGEPMGLRDTVTVYPHWWTKVK